MLVVRSPSEDLNTWLCTNNINSFSYLGSRGVLRCVHTVSFWIIIFIYHKRCYRINGTFFWDIYKLQTGPYSPKGTCVLDIRFLIMKESEPFLKTV